MYYDYYDYYDYYYDYYYYLAGAIVAARDEAVARLVEGAVGQRQDVRSQDLEQVEVLVLVRLDLLDQLVPAVRRLGPALGLGLGLGSRWGLGEPGCHRTYGTPEGAHAYTYSVRTVRGGAGASCPAPHVRTVRRRPARVAGAQSTGAPGRTSQLRRAQQLAQLRLAVLRDERLLADDLVDDHLEVALRRQLQQVHRLVAHLTALLVLEDDAWRVVPQQEAAQLHLTRLVGSPATPGERGRSRSGRHGWITGCVRPRCSRAH